MAGCTLKNFNFIKFDMANYQPLFALLCRARNKGIPGIRDNLFCCRTTQYQSQGFQRKTSQKLIKIYKSMQIVFVHGALIL